MFIEAHIPTYPCEKIEHSLAHKGFLASAPDFTFAVLSVENLRTSEFTWKKHAAKQHQTTVSQFENIKESQVPAEMRKNETKSI